MGDLSSKQLIQECQYDYPYHYIPEMVDGAFSQSQTWAWGMQYLGGVELVLSKLNAIDFGSLLDVGCGDGRFLREVSRNYPHADILGVDYSRMAIQLANAMNPDIEYICADITSEVIPKKYDVCTMIEVLEHIPPASIASFLQAVGNSMKPSGKLLITVPHENKRLTDKHYQHFSSRKLIETLSGTFSVESVFPFDRLSILNSYLLRMLGYGGSSYLITNPKINTWLYNRILLGCVTEQPEDRCGRLLAIAKLK